MNKLPMIRKNNLIRVVGKTTDEKTVVAGLFAAFDTNGFPFYASFQICKEGNMMVDWLELYSQAMTAKWKYETLRLRLEYSIVDTWGQEFCDVILERLDDFHEAQERSKTNHES